MKKESESKRYIFWGIIIGILILSFLILKDLFVVIISSVILAFALKPLQDHLSKKINPKLSALIILITMISIIAVFLIFFTTMFIRQIILFFTPSNINNFLEKFAEFLGSEIMERYAGDIINFITRESVGTIYPIIYQIPSLIIGTFIIFFTTYYLLLNWDNLETKIMNLIPFENKNKVLKQIKRKTTEIIYGTFLIVFIQMIFSAIFLRFLGVGPYLLLALAIGLLAFIPAVGPVFVWLPLTGLYFILGDYKTAIGVLIMGIILSNFLDALLRAKLLGSRTGTHPAIMLFGILGGIKIFGFIGLIIGPLVLIILLTIIENLEKKELNEKEKEQIRKYIEEKSKKLGSKENIGKLLKELSEKSDEEIRTLLNRWEKQKDSTN